MRKLAMFTILVLGTACAHAQLYSKVYTVQGGNYFNGRRAIQTNSQEYLFTGSMMMGGLYLSKLDALGDTVWNKTYSSGQIYQMDDLAESSDGSIYGSSAEYQALHLTKFTSTGDVSWSQKYGLSTNNSSSAGMKVVATGTDIIVAAGTQTDSLILMKVDATGNTIWSSRPALTSLLSTSTSKSCHVSDITKTVAGDYYILGRTTGDVGQPKNVFIMKINNIGNVLSTFTIDYDLNNMTSFYGETIVETANGDLLLGGVSNVDGYSGTTVLRINNSGTILWAKHVADNVYNSQAIELSTGEIIISSGNSTLPSDGVAKNSMIKLDAAGNFIWARTFGSDQGNYSFAVNKDVNDYSSVIGVTSGFNNLSGMYVYNVSPDGIATGCYDVLTSVPFTIWTPVSSSTSTSSGVLNYTFSLNTLTSGGNNMTMVEKGLTTSGVVTNPFCFGDDGNIAYTVSQGASPYSFSWSNGTNSQNLVNVGANFYQVRVADAEGCVKLDTFQISEPSQLIASSLVTDVTCFGSQNGAIDITTSGGTPGYSYLWATQDVSEDISGLSGGFYQVIITDANGCEKTIGVAISEPQQLFAAITSSQNVSCYGACDGSLSGLGSGGTSPYVLEWNDANNTIGSSVSNLCPGNYLFTVTDNNGCVSYSNGTITEPLPISSTTASSGSECGVTNGEASIDVVGGTMPYAYSWVSGDVADTATSLTPGSYNVTVTDNNGCVINESVMVNTLTNPIEICVVTVDSTDNKNMIVWEKPVSQNIQGFYIYRNISGGYSPVGYQPYDSISQFIDNSFGVDPAVTSYRYEISVLDSCGNESELSNFHETIHLTSNLGLNDEVNLIWDDYEGFSFTQYNILRDSTGNGNWEQIANVANTSFTYTDLTPPQSSSLRYLVEVVLPSTCSATKAQDHNTTRSNRASILDPNTGGGTSINELILSQAKVYPNPSKGLFSISVKSDNWSYSLFDMSGELILNEIVSEMNKEIDIQELEMGIYLMKINLGQNTVYKKVIKQ